MASTLEQFTRQAYERGFAGHRSQKEANWSRAFFEEFANCALAERQARSFAYALNCEPVIIPPLGHLAGQIYQACPGAGCPERSGSAEHSGWEAFSVEGAARSRVAAELPENELYARYFGDGAFPGHICWDVSRMLELGVEGLVAECRERGAAASDGESRRFYECVIIALEGMQTWVDGHVEALTRAAAAETDGSRRGELEAMAEICRQVPRRPAATFREAIQAIWFQHLAVMFENPFGGNGPGRLDYYLWPYLEADIDAGRATLDEARRLVTELFVLLHERIAPADGWVEALPVGGRMPDGSSAINPLSYQMIEIITELEQTHPSVYVRLHDDAPDDFVDLTARYLIAGRNRAQVYGDDAVIAALHGAGVSLEDARHWTAGGCMEVSPQGCNCDLLFSFAHNVARTFELVVNGGCLLQTGERAGPHDRDLTDYAGFEDLYEAFAAELERELRIMLRRLDIWLGCYAEFRPSFLMSSMTHDCLEKGRTINGGGARYTNYGGSGVGIPNVGDSLYAIRRAVFDEGRFTAAEVLEAMRANYAGHEDVRAYVQSLPKFGSDFDEVDALVNRVLLTFTDILHSHRTPHGGSVLPIILGFTWVVTHGEQVGATADGRLSGRPLAHGLSPQSGAATRGVSAAINSATRLSLGQVSGGGAMMWDLDPAWATPEVVKAMLTTFIAGGGHIFQGNIIDVDRLRQAQADPDAHRDLVVRVAGYSARFTALTKATQDEVIERHRFSG